MFNNFIKEFKATLNNQNVKLELNDFPSDTPIFNEFMKKFSGTTFNNGIYRIHLLKDIEKWTNIAIEAFPYLSGRIKCFSYDWLGRQFALDYNRISVGEPMILMLEIGTGEVLEIPNTFLAFHEVELIDYKDSALAENFFIEWFENSKISISSNQCVGYKVPLFLGGKDTIDNLELSDMEVYWGINSQLLG